MYHIGIDYSITSPAVCVYNDENGPFSFHACKFYFLSDQKKLQQSFGGQKFLGSPYPAWGTHEQRHYSLVKWVMAIFDNYIADDVMVYLEGYAMGAKGRVFNIGEATGLLKHYIHVNTFNFKTIPPTVVKKIATGKGNANKDAMYQAWLRDTGYNLVEMMTPNRKMLSSPVTDIVDSFYVLRAGLLSS